MKAVSEFKGFIKEPDGTYTAVILTRFNNHFSTSFVWLTEYMFSMAQFSMDYLTDKFCRQASESVESNWRYIEKVEHDLMYGTGKGTPVGFLSKGDERG